MNNTDKQAILDVMQQQEVAWNEGDIDSFMEGYWQSDSLKFVGKSGIKHGWKNTLDNYKKSYPNKDSMGQLHFDILELEVSNNTAFMLGKWSLIRVNDNPNGHFSLFWKKINNQWLITIDHSS